MELLAAHWPVLICLLVYLVACVGIGWYFTQRASRGVDDFYIAKRSVPGWVVSLAFFSTFASTNTYIGQAGPSVRIRPELGLGRSAVDRLLHGFLALAGSAPCAIKPSG